MKAPPIAAWLLQLRLFLMRAGPAGIGPAACGAVVLCLLGLAGWAWVFQQRAALARLETLPLAGGAAPAAAPPASGNQNLALFYDTLGQQRYAEQQVKTLFDLAAKNGLSLDQGEYKSGYDKASRVATYQATLPVKGAYQAIWMFSLQALRAVPFASLDEISFKREQIADAKLEARLRLTFYLKDAGSGGQP